MENPLMDKYQVAEHIGGITPRAAARLMKSMPCINMGSSEARPRLRVYQSDLLDWLAQRKMIRAMELIRSWVGDKKILACGVPLMPAFGLADYSRIGCDVGLTWRDRPFLRLTHRERVSTVNSILDTIYRRQLDGRAFGNDPDVFFLRTENLELTEREKDILATVNALLGSVFLTSDDPLKYTDEQKEKYAYYRHLTEAENVRLIKRERMGISCTCEYGQGKQEGHHC